MPDTLLAPFSVGCKFQGRSSRPLQHFNDSNEMATLYQNVTPLVVTCFNSKADGTIIAVFLATYSVGDLEPFSW